MAEKNKKRERFRPDPKGFINISGENVGAFFHKQGKGDIQPQIIKQARKSGQLNLSNRGMNEVPDIVWNINTLANEEVKALSLSINANDEDRWWDQVDLNKLILATNCLTTISPDISNLKALQILDLHDNQLKELPPSLGELRHLSKLNLSHNKISILPDELFTLKDLHYLFLHHNNLTEINDDIGNLSFLEELDISNNHLTSLPATFGFLSRIHSLVASNNHLTSVPLEIGDMQALSNLELTHNKLNELPDNIGNLTRLEQLYVRHNLLKALPPLESCSKLKEIQAGNNNITEIAIEVLETWIPIKILDLRDNKIQELPKEITFLQSLERLDLTNNDLTSLPFTLGTLPHLKSLSIEGNSLRGIRRDVIQRGTVQLLKWLRSRLNTDDLPAAPLPNTFESITNSIDTFKIKSSHSFSYSNKELSNVSKDILNLILDCQVTCLDLSKNKLSTLPENFGEVAEKMTEINLSFNKLQLIPPLVSSHLAYLNLGNNQLTNLPMGMANLPQLREINLGFNRFNSMPKVLFTFANLEILILSDNKIEEVDIDGLSKLSRLATLDLRNNSIASCPPKLGLLTHLYSLCLEGNTFRVPNADVLSKGTTFLLSYLRNRIPLENK